MVMYQRAINRVLETRLREPRRFVQVLEGPRQVGKTTSILQVLDGLGWPSHYASADGPVPLDAAWIETQWETARAKAAGAEGLAVLALDEVQKVSGWSEQVKKLWDEDERAGRDLRVVVLGSSPLLMRAGLTESLAGRFETVRATHWTLTECHEAFGWDLDTFIFFGGYPGAAALVGEPSRWRAYVTDSLIETSISRDILLMTRVDKPALLRRVFFLACEYSGRELSFTKMLGQLQDAGNTTTIAHYLDLLDGAGLVAGLRKYAGQTARRRGSSPKLLALNTGLVSALDGRSPEEAREDHEHWGRLVETAVGAYLASVAREYGDELYYWRRGGDEVDYVVVRGREVLGIEVKTGRPRGARGLAAFKESLPGSRVLIVGPGGMPLDDFLRGAGGLA
jgi:predicted AAA+ superfamily ATPase